jgi:hypothetical protein
VVTGAVIPATGEAGKTIQVQWTVLKQGAGDTIVKSWGDRIVASTDSVLAIQSLGRISGIFSEHQLVKRLATCKLI